MKHYAGNWTASTYTQTQTHIYTLCTHTYTYIFIYIYIIKYIESSPKQALKQGWDVKR